MATNEQHDRAIDHVKQAAKNKKRADYGKLKLVKTWLNIPRITSQRAGQAQDAFAAYKRVFSDA